MSDNTHYQPTPRLLHGDCLKLMPKELADNSIERQSHLWSIQ